METIKRFYSQRAITIATYFGGPLAAGFLVKKNFETLEQPGRAKRSLFIGIISTIVIFAGIFSVPESIIDKIPQMLIPMVYTGIIYLIVEKLQGDVLRQHKESGGEFYSGWRAALVGFIAMVILIGAIAVSAFIAGDLSKEVADFDTKAYDNEVAKFVVNEKNALIVFSVIETKEPDSLIVEFSKGVALWKENKRIVEKMNAIKNLPPELKEQDAKLLKYCDLRIQHNELIIKAISEETDKYVSEIEEVGSSIDAILEELK